MALVNNILKDIKNKKQDFQDTTRRDNMGKTDIITEGLSSSNYMQYELLVNGDSSIENPLHVSSAIYDIVNKYRGSLEYVTSTLSGPPGEGKETIEQTTKIIYNQITTPSLFNPYYGIPTAGITEGVPLLDTSKHGDKISAKIKGLKEGDGELNGTINLKYDINDCSIGNLVKLSNQDNSILGQARYKYTDFMYCRDLGKISNNYMITLRKFIAPIGDNIFFPASLEDSESNMEYPGDVGRMITWFGNDENKLDSILKYSYNATWKELNSEIQQQESQEADANRGIIGGLVNLFSPKYNQAAAKGITPNALSMILGSSGSSAFLSKAPYAGNPVLNGSTYDKNKVYEPKDTLRSTHIYEGKLVFNHEFNITFNYKLRGYDNINPKSAFLDLLANVLQVTYRQGTFWGGEQRILGAPPNKAGWNKAKSLMKEGVEGAGTFLSDILNGKSIQDSASKLAQSLSNMTKSIGFDPQQLMSAQGREDLIKKIKESSGNAQWGEAITGTFTNQLGVPAVYAFDSLLTNDAVGLWHVTIGNPLNPIVSMGNLIMTNCEVTQSGPLGLDDFPTELKVVVTLKHGMPRDAVDIQKMYTKGRNAIHSKISNPENYKLSGLKDNNNNTNKNEETSKAKTITNTNNIKSGTLEGKTLSDLGTKSSDIYSWIGDYSIGRIAANRSNLK